MARLEELVGDIPDERLRQSIQDEVVALKGRVKFGLVYERHIPETALVNDADLIGVGSSVRPRAKVDKEVNYRVVEVNGGNAVITPEGNGATEEVPVAELFAVLPFGEPVYPTVAPVDDPVSRSKSKPYHVVINGENYHALQLLTHVQARSIDCIYIDPPYNTGATDWKYNNRYVDKNDSYRHSKWLSMMEKRLRLARLLLKDDGVLICTIGEDEINHLGVLLEEIFPDASRQLVTICINPGGAGGADVLSRVEEYAFFCFFGGATPAPTEDDMLVSAIDTDAAHTGARGIRWEWLMRGGNAWYRASRENLCYPIILSADGTMIEGVGQPYEGAESKRPLKINGRPVAWPVRKDGKLGIWRVEGPTLMKLKEKGYAFVSARDEKRGTWTIKYLLSGTIESIASGLVEVTGYGERGEVQVRVSERRGKTAKTIWYRGRHTAGGAGGTHLLNALLGERDLFPFPKSVYAVRDSLEIAVGNRPNAKVLDFFGGSGTTLHATCMLNAEDGGSRQAIIVTNNEVNPTLTKKMNKNGLFRGNADFEARGIFEAATKPRCKAAITGKRPDGKAAEGSYLNGRAIAEGYQENIEFFRLDYLNPDGIELGRGFDALHPLLWLAAGAKKKRAPKLPAKAAYFIADAGYAVLFDLTQLPEFAAELADRDDIDHVYVITDSQEAFAEAREKVGHGRTVSMLYRDYLQAFRLSP